MILMRLKKFDEKNIKKMKFNTNFNKLGQIPFRYFQ